MKNTLVTAIYYSSPNTRMGGRGYSFEFYEAPFRNILNLGCYIVIYSQESEKDKIINFMDKYEFTEYIIIDYDLNNFLYSDKIYELKEHEGLIDQNGLKNDKDYIANDRNHHLCLSKLKFLNMTIENKYFNSEKYFWIDAGLFHHGIIPETFGGIEKFTKVNENNYLPKKENSVCNYKLIDLLLTKNNMDYILMGLEEYPASLWWFDICDKPKKTHIIGGLFGGSVDFLNEFTTKFNTLIYEIFELNKLTLEEEIFSIINTNKNYNYLSFKTWYHDIPTDPNYFGLESTAKSFYKLFLKTT